MTRRRARRWAACICISANSLQWSLNISAQELHSDGPVTCGAADKLHLG